MPITRREWWWATGILGTVLLATLWAYAPALSGPFVYDDAYFVERNDAIQDPRRATEYLFSPDSASEGKAKLVFAGSVLQPAVTSVRTTHVTVDSLVDRFKSSPRPQP